MVTSGDMGAADSDGMLDNAFPVLVEIPFEAIAVDDDVVVVVISADFWPLVRLLLGRGIPLSRRLFADDVEVRRRDFASGSSSSSS